MIEAKNLSMYYGPTLALDDVSFTVKENEIVGLLGPNGAGKSTLMRILTTYIYPTFGTALVGGFDIKDYPLEARRIIGYLPETPPLYMDMRVDEYLDFIGQARGLSRTILTKRKEWVIESLKIAGVWKHMMSELSLGYRQRVGLAQALLHDPKLVILDEPTSGLDPMQIVGIRQLIRDLAREKTVVFSTHILQEASAVSDRLMIIDQGQIVASGTLPELKQQKLGAQRFVVTVCVRWPEMETALRALPGLKDPVLLHEGEGFCRFLCAFNSSYDQAAQSVSELCLQKGWVLRELGMQEPTLEEVFLGLFKKKDSLL